MMKDRGAHQFDEGLKDRLSPSLNSCDDRLEGRVCSGPPLRPESVGHLTIDDTGPKRLLRFVIGRRDAGVMKEDKQFLSVLDQPPLEFNGRVIPNGLIQQFIQLLFKPHDAIDIGLDFDFGALGSEAIVQMDRGPEEALHRTRPGISRRRVQDPVQIAQEVLQAELNDFRRRF